MIREKKRRAVGRKRATKPRIARLLPARLKIIRRILGPIDKETENGSRSTEHLLATLPAWILREMKKAITAHRARIRAKKRREEARKKKLAEDRKKAQKKKTARIAAKKAAPKRQRSKKKKR